MSEDPIQSSQNVFKDEFVTREERILGLVTIHENVKQHSAYLERLTEAGWDKAFMEYLPQVERKQSLYDYYRVLQRFIALLEDGHTNVYFPPSVHNALDWIPIRLDIVEDTWIVVQRYPTDDVIGEDIPPGSILESIEDMPPSKYFAEKFYPFIAAGRERIKLVQFEWTAQYPKNTTLKLKLRYPGGSQHKRAIKANRSTVQWTPELTRNYVPAWRQGGSFSSCEPEPGILYLSFGTCDQESENQLITLLESRSSQWPDGVILDLRDNGGGCTPTECVRRLISKPIHWYDCVSRWSISRIAAQLQFSKSGDESAALFKQYELPERFSLEWYDLNWQGDLTSPAEIHYDGPLVILVGSFTCSAAEDMVVLLKQAGRGTVIGERTFGSTGQPFLFNLPGGGGGRVCTVRCRYADGNEYIGVGCEPNITVKPTIKGIVEGQDEVLNAALHYLHISAQSYGGRSQ